MNVLANDRQPSTIIDAVGTLLPFAIAGVFFGGCFHWITSLPNLTDFWFIKGDKFLIPTYKYHLAFSTSLFFSLLSGYCIARLQSMRVHHPSSVVRYFVTAILIFASAPGAAFLVDKLMGLKGIFLSVILFLLILPLSAWIFTNVWQWWGFALIVFSPFIALVITYVAMKLFHLSNPSIELVQWTMVECLLSVSVGYWLMKKGNRAQTQLSKRL